MNPDDVLRRAEERGLIGEHDTAVILYDLDVLDRQIERVRRAFPDDAWHAVAVKSNPLVCVLSVIAAHGLFAEAASAEELALARAAGFEDRTVWDSPAKTRREITEAMTGSPPRLVNVDSLAELDRYGSGDIRLGLRVNPEQRPDTIASLATGVAGSKFGVPISQRRAIIEAYEAEPRLTAMHVHSGSNSRSLRPMVDAVASVVALADEINERPSTRDRIDTIDIGGGLRYSDDADEPLSVERYAAMLASDVPQLFDGRYRIVTEFGRFHHLGAGMSASRVEYVTATGDHTHAVVHLGADSFVREVYDSDNWDVDVAPVRGADDRAGDVSNPSTAERRTFDVVGPLCFEGDVLARSVPGPVPEPGEWLTARSTGANTFSLWSRHCSRAFPTVLLVRSSDVDAGLRVGKTRETLDDIVSFWS